MATMELIIATLSIIISYPNLEHKMITAEQVLGLLRVLWITFGSAGPSAPQARYIKALPTPNKMHIISVAASIK